MTLAPEDVIKLLLAAAIGGAVGMERELHHKAAGFRTITLICMGATVFTILSIRLDGVGRIAANIVTGIGFLGAGVILHESSRIKGLTTAADVWMSAALGMAVGAGNYLFSVLATGLVLVMMYVFALLERWVDSRWDRRQYQITFLCDLQKIDQLESNLVSSGLRLGLRQRMKREGVMICTWEAAGSSREHKAFVTMMLADPDVKEIQW